MNCNKKLSLRLLSAAVIAGLAVCFSAAHAHGQVLLSETFQAPLQSRPTAWGAFGGANVHDIRAWPAMPNTPEYGLRIVRTGDGGGTGSNVIYTASNSFGDFEGSVLLATTGFNATGTDNAGILLRAQTTDFASTQGYYISLVGLNTLTISRDPTTHLNSGTILASTAIAPQRANDTATRIDFSAVGSSISASAFAWNSVNETWSLLATVSVTDTTYTAGMIGLRAGMIANGRGAFFADLEVSAIPEPSAFAALLGVFTLGFTLLGRRRCRG